MLSFSCVCDFYICFGNPCYHPLCQKVMRLCHKVNIIMQKKGDFLLVLYEKYPLTISKHCKSIKGIFAFLTCRAKTTFFNTAKQKISSDPNTIKVSVVRVRFDLGRIVDIMRENSGRVPRRAS